VGVQKVTSRETKSLPHRTSACIDAPPPLAHIGADSPRRLSAPQLSRLSKCPRHAGIQHRCGANFHASVVVPTWQKFKVLIFGVKIPRPQNGRSPDDLGLPSETVHFRSDDSVGLEGSLIAPPNPKGTILLFHGYGASRSSLLDEAHAFYDLGFAALLVDFRGGGGSDGNATTLGYNEANDVTAAIAFTQSRGLPRPLVLYGQSMGAAAILRSIAAFGTKPDAVILESVFGRMLGAIRNRFDLMGAPSFPSAELLVFWGSTQSGISGFSHNPEEYARACTCPALVLHGAKDRHARLEEGRAVYEDLAGSKEMVVFDQAGHIALFGTEPQRWREVVGQFLGHKVEGK
jgi:pimeloyl-ACP methyl ester carboxylesterase